MKAGLVSNFATTDFDANQRRILELAGNVVEQGAKLLLFPEAAATGLCDTGDPTHDLLIAEPVPGPRNGEWRRFAREHKVWFAAGLLEKDQGKIYDSCVLFDPGGNLALHYRRIDPHWHRPSNDPLIYSVGKDIPVVETPFGRSGILVCGDLWDDEIVAKFKESRVDLLLYPFLRSVQRAKNKEEEWSKELPLYIKRWAMTGAAVLAVNLFEGMHPDASLGGAWFVGEDGQILESIPILKEGILIVELGPT